MHLSTSNSSNAAARAIAVLLSLLALYALALEVGARVAMPIISEGVGRISKDYRAARLVHPVSASGTPSLLLVGNSLLLDGVDRSALTEGLSSTIDASMLPIEGTSYLDWYFGMGRLYTEGSRPSTIVLCMNARQLISKSTNGEFFSHFMMRFEDLPAVIRASELNTMTSSNYLFSHWSMWLATRTNVRIGLLERLLPGARDLAARFSTQDSLAINADPEIADRALERLRQFRDLAKAHGAEFIWVVPPTTNQDDPSPLLRKLADSAGIRVLIPYSPGEMPIDHYADGFHLNREGARKFTERLVPLLRESTE